MGGESGFLKSVARVNTANKKGLEEIDLMKQVEQWSSLFGKSMGREAARWRIESRRVEVR